MEERDAGRFSSISRCPLGCGPSNGKKGPQDLSKTKPSVGLITATQVVPPLPLITPFIMLFCVAKFLESVSSVADFNSSFPRHSSAISSQALAPSLHISHFGQALEGPLAISCHHCTPPLGPSLLWLLWSLFLPDFLLMLKSLLLGWIFISCRALTARSSPYLAVSLPLPLVFLLFFSLGGFLFIFQATIHSKKLILYSAQ